TRRPDRTAIATATASSCASAPARDHQAGGGIPPRGLIRTAVLGQFPLTAEAAGKIAKSGQKWPGIPHLLVQLLCDINSSGQFPAPRRTGNSSSLHREIFPAEQGIPRRPRWLRLSPARLRRPAFPIRLPCLRSRLVV